LQSGLFRVHGGQLIHEVRAKDATPAGLRASTRAAGVSACRRVVALSLMMFAGVADLAVGQARDLSKAVDKESLRTTAVLPSGASGQVLTESVKLLASDGAGGDFGGDSFGNSVSISGGVAVVGAHGDDDNGIDSGSAYVFRWTGAAWDEEQKLLASDGSSSPFGGDSFGASVSVLGDVVVVGAPNEDDACSPGVRCDSGSAYVFRWNGTTWIEEQKLLASDARAGDRFGNSVSVSGDVAVVGAYQDNGRWTTNSGSAYVFRWNGSAWEEEQKLLASNGSSDDQFGKSVSVSVSGDVAVVGANGDDDNGSGSGSAYVFRWTGSAWDEEQKLLASDGVAGDNFGWSASVSGDVALVGTNLYDNADASGSAYVFRWNGATWIEQQKLLAWDGTVHDEFGGTVSVLGDVAVVGATGDDDNGLASGSAYVFRWNGTTWVPKQKLLASDGARDDLFGISVSVSGDVAVVGARGDDDNGSRSGSAYVYSLTCGDSVTDAFETCDDGNFEDGDGCSGCGVECGYACDGGEPSVCTDIDECALGTDKCDANAICTNTPGSFDCVCDLGYFGNGLTCAECPSGRCLQDESAKLLASDGGEFDEFGSSVSVSGDVAVVGARWDDDNGGGSGSAYVFRRTGAAWDEEQKLLASDGGASGEFGVSVSVSGDVAVVGRYRDWDACPPPTVYCNSGSAYVFRWNGITWVEEQKLLASNGLGADRFGSSVSVSGNVAVVGAPHNGGAAYVFRWNGAAWEEEQELWASDGVPLDIFGDSVSVSGDVVVVGARLADDACPSNSGCRSGSAYIFRWNGTTWIEEQKLLASDGARDDLFGISVSVSGDVAVVGASGDDDACLSNSECDSGSAYVFRYDPSEVTCGQTWCQEHKLLASDGATEDRFGSSVSVSGVTAVVGAYHGNDTGADSGAAYVFVLSGGVWTQQQKLTASDAAADDRFGWSVSNSDDMAVVGALLDDDVGDRSGSAYVFELGPLFDDCNDNGIDDAEEIAGCDGNPECGDCDADGAPDGCQPDADGDALIDECDACSDSQMGETVTIGPCDAGVLNVVFEDGCTMADMLAECGGDPQNHGDFVTCVNETARTWREDRILSGAEFGKIVSCAAKSDVGRGRDPIKLRKTAAPPKE